MSKGPSTFRQRDVMAALKAARLAGAPVARVEISNGKITLVMGKPGEVSLGELNDDAKGAAEWDKRIKELGG